MRVEGSEKWFLLGFRNLNPRIEAVQRACRRRAEGVQKACRRRAGGRVPAILNATRVQFFNKGSIFSAGSSFGSGDKAKRLKNSFNFNKNVIF